MSHAILAVQKGMSIRNAAASYNIPKSTLGDRMSGGVVPGSTSGPPAYLTSEEEEQLVKFLTGCASIGYARSKKEVMALVSRVIEGKGKHVEISNGWWESFKKRNPKLILRLASPLSYVRAIASDRDTLDCYYNLLEKTLLENGLLENPCNIFNCDETGMPLDSTGLRIVVEIGVKNPVHINSGCKSQITVLACVSAPGYSLPPFVIFDRKSLNPQLVKGEVPGTTYGLSTNGWIDQELFHHWFIHHFLRHAPASRPLLLVMDGHSSHYCPETINAAAEEGVILFALPPHTTHLLQPLDRGCFSPLKMCWRQVCHSYMVNNPGRMITRFEFSALLSEAWFKAMTVKNVRGGFKVTGIYPFDRNAVSLPEDTPSSPSLSKSANIPFIPLFSPAPSHRQHGLPKSHCCTEPSTSADEQDLSVESAEHSDEEVCYLTQRGTAISRTILITPKCPSKLPRKRAKNSGRVLTSVENRQIINEKQEKKEEALKQKEQRKMERERKAEARRQLKASKKTSKKYVCATPS